MKAELDVITITIRKGADEEWPSGHEQLVLSDAVEREFEVIEISEPYSSGTWSFIMRERNHRAVVRRINELIRECTGKET